MKLNIMHIKSYSILFSFLLVGNFFIELNSHAWPNTYSRLQRIKRSDNSFRQNLDISLTNNIENILIFRNTTSNRALVIDLDKDALLLLDGSSGSGIIVIENENRGALIPNALWEARRESIENFLKSINNDIIILLKQSGSQQFTLDNCPLSILQEVSKIVQNLVIFIDLELQQAPVLALELVVSILVSIVKLRNLYPEVIQAIIQNQNQLIEDICGLLNIFQGLYELSAALNTTNLDIIELKSVLALAPNLKIPDGIVDLISYFHQIAMGDVDLSPLGPIFNDPENFLDLLVQISGDGIVGILKFVSEILAIVIGSSSQGRLISYLTQNVAQSSQQILKDLGNILKQG